jgi:hypothetical protein
VKPGQFEGNNAGILHTMFGSVTMLGDPSIPLASVMYSDQPNMTHIRRMNITKRLKANSTKKRDCVTFGSSSTYDQNFPRILLPQGGNSSGQIHFFLAMLSTYSFIPFSRLHAHEIGFSKNCGALCCRIFPFAWDLFCLQSVANYFVLFHLLASVLFLVICQDRYTDYCVTSLQILIVHLLWPT